VKGAYEAMEAVSVVNVTKFAFPEHYDFAGQHGIEPRLIPAN